VTSLERIRDAATPAKTTVLAYRDALARLFILDPVDGWAPTSNHLKRLTQSAKHHLADPALAAALLGITEDRLLKGEGGRVAIPRAGGFLGALFESGSPCRFGSSRTQPRRGSGTCAPAAIVRIEVTLSAVDDDDVAPLRWLRDALKGNLRAAVVITTGPHAYRRPDGIYVVPLALSDHDARSCSCRSPITSPAP
jgi:hypothetical protein